MLRRAAPLVLAVVLGGCMDQEPFGFAYRSLPGPYELQELNNGAQFILHGPGAGRFFGGGGHVEAIGFDERYIVAYRDTPAHDGAGWVIVDVKGRRARGPYTGADLAGREEVAGIEPAEPRAVWAGLPTGYRWVVCPGLLLLAVLAWGWARASGAPGDRGAA
jgi:hypothetical protein